MVGRGAKLSCYLSKGLFSFFIPHSIKSCEPFTSPCFKSHHHFSEADAFFFSDFNCLLSSPYSFGLIAITLATEYKISFNFFYFSFQSVVHVPLVISQFNFPRPYFSLRPFFQVEYVIIPPHHPALAASRSIVDVTPPLSFISR